MALDFTEKLGLGANPYPSRRMPVLARRGMVATEDPLAAQAGLKILQAGGNAVDAAIATAITLTVTAPAANGVGSDAFAMVWDGTKLHGLNASGRACAAQTPQLFAEAGCSSVPMFGWMSVSVPGAPAAWQELHRRFGRLPFESLFRTAIEYAEQGFPVAPLTAARWATSAKNHAALPPRPELAEWAKTFLRNGRAPCAGETWSSPDLAKTLRALAKDGCGIFYEGALANRIADFAASTGGYMTRADLAAHRNTWDAPISVSYRGHEIWELPPNTPGILALSALAILEGFEVAKHPRESAETYHLLIEAFKTAYADAHGTIADPAHVRVTVESLLDARHVARQRAKIGERATTPDANCPPRGGTVYLCAADADGMMVSFIQSNYSGPMLGFGSGVVVPGTGIALQSRASAFSLDPSSPNVIAPGKRPAHTLIPAFMTREGEAVGAFGVMGGPMQPQGHMQLVVNQLDFGLHPQASIDAPRWQWLNDTYVDIERGVPESVARGLAERGHELSWSEAWDVATTGIRPTPSGKLAMYGDFGKAQMICRRRDGTYVAGSEPRADGCAVGY